MDVSFELLPVWSTLLDLYKHMYYSTYTTDAYISPYRSNSVTHRLPTPIQAEAVPLILGGGDVMAAAETGSGKTGAFALPVLQITHESLVNESKQFQNQGRSNNNVTQELPPCLLNPEDRDEVFAISPDGLKGQARSELSWGGCRANLGATKGKVYYEAIISDEGLCRVGWSTPHGNLDIGTDKQTFGYGGTGKKSHNRIFEDYGESFGLNDAIGCLLDLDNRTISYTKNGQPLGEAFTLPTNLKGRPIHPAVVLKNAEIFLNFGHRNDDDNNKAMKQAFKFPPPPGFIPIAAAPPASLSSWQRPIPASSTTTGGPIALILEPARDLAEQTHDNITLFSKHLTNPVLKNALLVGGVSGKDQQKYLQAGVHIVTGTPGRVIEFIETGRLRLDSVRFFVLDEADKLLETGNREAILKIFQRLPKGGSGTARLQVLLFSATLHSPEVRELAKTICQNPILVDLKGKDHVPETVDHVVVMVDPKEDRSWLQSNPSVFTDNLHMFDTIGTDVNTAENWSQATKKLKQRMLQRVVDTLQMEQALIFCRTNFDCDNLERFLNSLGGGTLSSKANGPLKRESGREHPYSCLVLAGQRSMEERRTALAAFKEGDVRFLIATDVAARGIDIQGLPFVINMTLPDRSEDYIHRVGRVGRADALGLAVSLVSTVPEKVWFCSVKGYKPWTQPDKQNTQTNDKKGGQAVWYNEQELLTEVEERLGKSVVRLPADLSLPPEVAAKLSNERGEGQRQKYGQAKEGVGSEAGKEVAERVAAIKPLVKELAALEHQAQLSFFSLKRKWTIY